MRFQDYMIDQTRKAAAEAFRYVKAVPAEKLEWKPLEEGRSALDMAREMALCPGWCEELIANAEPYQASPDAYAKIQQEMEALKSLDECEAECARRLDSLAEMLRTYPDVRLDETKYLPYDGGRDFTIAEIIDYPRWNFNYHAGQIAYIQTLYGDRDMH